LKSKLKDIKNLHEVYITLRLFKFKGTPEFHQCM